MTPETLRRVAQLLEVLNEELGDDWQITEFDIRNNSDDERICTISYDDFSTLGATT